MRRGGEKKEGGSGEEDRMSMGVLMSMPLFYMFICICIAS